MNTTNTPSRTFCYVRVSSREQVLNGQSIQTQTGQLRMWCKNKGHILSEHSFSSGSPGVFVDPGVSAWHKSPLLGRPAFTEIMRHAKPGDQIICTRLDRAFRSVQDFCYTWPIIEGKGISFVFTQQGIDTSTAWGKCRANIFAAFAQLKSDLISQRVREGLAAKKAGIQMARRSRDMLKMEVDPLLKIDKPPTAKECDSDKGRVWSYARCSSWDQSVASQIPQLRYMVDMAMEEGYSYGGSFADEGVSAYNVAWSDRPAGSALWKSIQPGDVICISRIDRAFRSLFDLLTCYKQLKEMKVGLRIEDQHIREDDETMLQIMVAVSEMESKDLSARIKEGMSAVAAIRGKRIQRTHCPWWQEVAIKNKKWSFVPNYQALAEFEEIITLLDEGHTKVSASDIMEEKLAHRDRRLWIPGIQTGVYAPRFIRHKSKTYADEWVRNFKRYARQEEKRMTNYSQGHVRRPWTAKRISDRMDSQEEIEALYSDSPETYNKVLEVKSVN